LEGWLDWRKLPGRAATGRADLRVTAGRVLELENDDVFTETGEGRFGFVLQNGNLESGVLDMEFPGTGFIDIDFGVNDVIGSKSNNLQGRAIARLDNLRLLGQLLFPAVDDIDGQFESDLRLGGTLTDPLFDGGFRVANGRVRYAPVGLNITNIGLEGLLAKRGQGSLKGQFQAGEGTGVVDGRIVYDTLQNLQLDIALSGDRLLLVNTDNLKLSTVTDLRIGLSPQRTEINGRIVVPSARLTASNLALEKVTDSEDLVVETNGGTPAPAAKAPGNRVFGELEVAFGDDVVMNVPDIQTQISGSVLFKWNGGPVPVGDGSYKLRGKVDVYGPSLQIENGSINFPGIPADNPQLNIRAERDIYGNTQIRSAGVSVTGSLKRPVVEAYTIPDTNRDRAWTLLVTGSDFDQGQGVGGFDVGTYIAPRLYVSYGISLFEDENVLSARYDLKKGFGVKISSDNRETGVDVSYTLDR
jgi:translocation and assembly module TamB